MAMIFPGMDPYLENPHFWPGVHASMIVYIRDQLQPLIRPRYLAAIEERVYLEGAECDAPVLVRVATQEIHETYIEIVERESGQNVVTVIEVVSPTNKYAGPGRNSYLAKQREVMNGTAHLVEIDLLRHGPHVLAVPERAARTQAEYDYLVGVNRAVELREEFELYPRRLRERLPRVRIPLSGTDPDVRLDLPALIAHIYESGCYAERIHYDQPCVPALSDDDQTWANELLRQASEAGPASE
jgi:hypothetical protein